MTEAACGAIRRIAYCRTYSLRWLATQDAIWLRLEKPSLVRMCWTWVCAVRSDTNRAAAIERLVLPWATSSATSLAPIRVFASRTEVSLHSHPSVATRRP